MTSDISWLRLVTISDSAREYIARKPTVAPTSAPKLPPRPQSSIDSYRSTSSIPPSLPARPSAAKTSDTTVSSSTASRKPPPPIPGRSPAMQSMESLTNPSPAKWGATSASPSKRGVADSPTQSPILTPASTGDYMLVTSPNSRSQTHRAAPPIPARTPQPAPQTRPSLDLNGSPPDGLVSPVAPDIATAKTAVKGPPPAPPSKPTVIKSVASSKIDESMPLVSPKKGGGPPIIPKKPVALRSTSAQGE